MPLLAIALATAPDVVKPRWQIDATPAQWLLSRTMAGSDPGFFAISTVPGSDTYRIVLAGDSVPSLAAEEQRPATISFDDDQRHFGVFALRTEIPSFKNAFQIPVQDAAMLAAFAHSASVSVQFKKGTLGPVVWGNATKAATALENCITEQLTDWGADPAQFVPGGAQPVALKARDDWLTMADLERIHHGPNGLDARYRLTIAIDGKIDGCVRLNRPDRDDADGIVCPAIMSKALFTPAHDAAGKAVRGAATFQFGIVTRSVR